MTKLPPYPLILRILDEDSGPIGSAIADLHLPSYITARNYFNDILEVR